MIEAKQAAATIKLGSLVLTQPYRDYIPELSPEDRDSLKRDIAAVGRLEQPIVIDETGAIIDGHHRAAIAAELGLDPKTVSILTLPGLSDSEKIARAISLNVKRRHLTTEQKQAIARRLRAEGWSTWAIAEAMGVYPSTVVRWSPEIEACSTVANATVEHAIVQSRDGKTRPRYRPDEADLSQRRAEVRKLREQGLTIRAIADRLGISEGTVALDLKAGAAILATSVNKAKIEEARNWGVACLYAYIDLSRRRQPGFWCHTPPRIDRVLIPDRWNGVELAYFAALGRRFFPEARIKEGCSVKGTKDPFVIVPDSELARLTDWRALVDSAIELAAKRRLAATAR